MGRTIGRSGFGLAFTIFALSLFAAMASFGTPAGAQEAPTTSSDVTSTIAPSSTVASPTTTMLEFGADSDEPPDTAPSIIPLPNSGAAPKHEGDRGSFTQYAVMFGTIGAIGLLALLVRRESAKHADNKTPMPSSDK